MRRRWPRRAVLATAIAAPLTSALGQTPGLLALARARGLAFGTMVTAHQVRDTPGLAALLRADAGFITPGLELKWAALRPAPDRFDFTDADHLAAFAAQEGMGLRGHTLIWHEAMPAWFDPALPAAAMAEMLRLHVRTVAGRYGGRILSWDVVNEPVEPWDRRPDGLRDTPFLRALGPDYIRQALEWTAEADPAARLVINEYDLEFASREQKALRWAMLRLLERLVRQGVPLHALGLQAHLAPRSARFDAAVLQRFLRDVADLGLAIEITELDIIDRLLPADIAARDAGAAAMLRDFLAVVLEEKAVRLIALWGLADSQGWQDWSIYARRKDRLPARGQLYDTDLHRKPAWQAVAAALRDTPLP